MWFYLFTSTILHVLAIRSIYALNDRVFPSNFKIGTGSAAYQIEGGWQSDGKGVNVFDIATHQLPPMAVDNGTGDISTDSYHHYKEDIKLLKELGVDFYRFSLSWSRILPDGFAGNINKQGIKYYRNLLEELRKANIEPHVTIFHWDLPLPLQDLGGWMNPFIVDYFVDYAKVCFDNFGDLVKVWFTINEPHQLCTWILPFIASNRNISGIREYLCGHNALIGHAKVYHLYDKHYKPIQGGRIGIVHNSHWYEPVNNEPENIEATTRRLAFSSGWFAHPIVHGNYPPLMIERIRNRSLEEGFPRSRLPEFTPEEIQEIKGTQDFFAINHYTSKLIKPMKPNPDAERYLQDIGTVEFDHDSWEATGTEWLKVTPWGLRKFLKWIKSTYNDPEIFITENGYPDNGGLDNHKRTNYYKEYLSACLDAIYNDKVNLSVYTVWSFLDSFEWYDGYRTRFGLYEVDFNDPGRKRTPKTSVKYLQKIIANRCLVETCRTAETSR